MKNKVLNVTTDARELSNRKTVERMLPPQLQLSTKPVIIIDVYVSNYRAKMEVVE